MSIYLIFIARSCVCDRLDNFRELIASINIIFRMKCIFFSVLFLASLRPTSLFEIVFLSIYGSHSSSSGAISNRPQFPADLSPLLLDRMLLFRLSVIMRILWASGIGIYRVWAKNPSIKSSTMDGLLDSCLDLCLTKFKATECDGVVYCDQSAGFVCRNLFSPTRLKATFFIRQTSSGFAISCEEARKKMDRRRSNTPASEPPSKRKARMRVTFFGDIEEHKVFHKDLASSAVGTEQFDPQIGLHTFFDLYDEIGSLMDVPVTLLLGPRFPGMPVCLGPDRSVLVDLPTGSQHRIIFDITTTDRFTESIDGSFVLSFHPIVSSLRKAKALQYALNRIATFAVQMYPVSSGSMKKECESQLLVEEDFEYIKNVDNEKAGLVIASAIEKLSLLHYLGLVHRDIQRAFVWDGADHNSVKIRNFNSSFFFLDRNGQHVSIAHCTVYEDEKIVRFKDPENDCISRAADMEDLAEFLTETFGSVDHLKKALDKFEDYTRSIPYREKPEYQTRIDLFKNM